VRRSESGHMAHLRTIPANPRYRDLHSSSACDRGEMFVRTGVIASVINRSFMMEVAVWNIEFNTSEG
jgi:hypothetical protein